MSLIPSDLDLLAEVMIGIDLGTVVDPGNFRLMQGIEK